MYAILNYSQQLKLKRRITKENLYPTRGYGRIVLDFLLRRRNLKFLKVKNKTIADDVGCSERTVRSWTSRFAKLGLLVKWQTNSWAPNNYKILVPEKVLFSLWVDTLSYEDQEFILNHGITRAEAIKYQTFRHSYNLVNLNILLPIPYPYMSNNIRAHTREVFDSSDGSARDGMEGKQKREKVRKGIQMLKEEQKEWLRKHNSDEGIQELIKGPKVRRELFSKDAEELISMLSLDEREQLKLVAYPEEAIKHGLESLRPICYGTVAFKGDIRDRMGFLLAVMNSFCKMRLNVEPDWKWYFDLCSILKITPLQPDEAPKALVIRRTPPTPPVVARKNEGWSARDPWKGPKIESRQTKKDRLIKDIETYKRSLGDPDTFIPGYKFFPEALKLGQLALARCIQELRDLEVDELFPGR